MFELKLCFRNVVTIVTVSVNLFAILALLGERNYPEYKKK